jgi:hypothetical protein
MILEFTALLCQVVKLNSMLLSSHAWLRITRPEIEQLRLDMGLGIFRA